MQKISNLTATATSDGLFTNGSVASGVSPTILDAGWFNTVQNELVNLVSGAGLSLDPDNNAQVLAALKGLFTLITDFKSLLATPGYQRLPGGFILQWGTATIPLAGSVSVTYPLSITSGYLQLVSPIDVSSTNNYRVGVATSSTTGLTLASTNAASVTGVMWISIGKISS